MKFKVLTESKSIDKEVMFRVLRGKDIDSFRTNHPQFFTKNIEYAKEYAFIEESPIIYKVELTIKDPFDLSTDEQIEIFNTQYIPWANANREIFKQYIDNPTDKIINNILQPKSKGDTLDFVNADYVFMFLKKNPQLGYDGLIVDEGQKRYPGLLSYVPFNENQITILDKVYADED